MIKAVISGLLLASLVGGETWAASAGALETMRKNGDLPAERRHVWSIFAHLTQPGAKDRSAFFDTWHGEGEIFSGQATGRGIRGFSRTGMAGVIEPSAAAPVLTYTLYNEPAYQHIVRHRLNSAATLETLRKSGAPHDTIAGSRTVPDFPSSSIVLKTAWWPVARSGLTALPIWDADRNPPRRNGNPYPGWRRVVAVDTSAKVHPSATVGIDFAGATHPQARRVGLDAFYRVTVDGAMAARIMRDPESRKAVLIALGRPLQAGDHLALVGANLATRELPDWIWAAFWWHDRPGQGPYAHQRPKGQSSPWRNYLMQAAFDSEKPASGAGPHVSFNPWLEARFPDGGHGGGTASNCLACHRRASYPPLPFLPVTRGAPDLRRDQAFAPGRLRTSFLWSLAMHAKPASRLP